MYILRDVCGKYEEGSNDFRKSIATVFCTRESVFAAVISFRVAKLRVSITLSEIYETLLPGNSPCKNLWRSSEY